MKKPFSPNERKKKRDTHINIEWNKRKYFPTFVWKLKASISKFWYAEAHCAGANCANDAHASFQTRNSTLIMRRFNKILGTFCLTYYTMHCDRDDIAHKRVVIYFLLLIYQFRHQRSPRIKRIYSTFNISPRLRTSPYFFQTLLAALNSKILRFTML